MHPPDAESSAPKRVLLTKKEEEAEQEEIEPAPHTAQASTGKWKKVIQQKGPVGLLVQSLYMMGARITKDVHRLSLRDLFVLVCARVTCNTSYEIGWCLLPPKVGWARHTQ